ncbi:MAG: hypothetical protein ACFFB9_03500 [Promethearchaeota archaeon]
MIREVYIFDIDGCIMPPIFINFNNSEPRRKIVNQVIKNGNNVKLFPRFIDFYNTHCKQASLIYFITGRKASEFSNLTEQQLKFLAEIKDFQVIYYPEGKPHKIHKYFDWKVKEIKGIIKDIIKSKSFNEQAKIKFNIFDDMNDYFRKLRKITEKWRIQINLTLIESENDWKNLFK